MRRQMRRRGVRTSLGKLDAGSRDAAGWPMRMSRPLAAKGNGACLKRVLNTRLPPTASKMMRWSMGDPADEYATAAEWLIGNR